MDVAEEGTVGWMVRGRRGPCTLFLAAYPSRYMWLSAACDVYNRFLTCPGPPPACLVWILLCGPHTSADRMHIHTHSLLHPRITYHYVCKHSGKGDQQLATHRPFNFPHTNYRNYKALISNQNRCCHTLIELNTTDPDVIWRSRCSLRCHLSGGLPSHLNKLPMWEYQN